MSRRSRIGRGIILAASCLLAWQCLTSFVLVRPVLLPSPYQTAKAALDLLATPDYQYAVARTLWRLCLALAAASIFGIPIGLWLTYRRGLQAWCSPVLDALRSLPASALFPLLLLVIGVGEPALITLALYPSLLIIIASTISGGALSNERRIAQGRALGLSTWEMLTDVVFYEALPGVLAGVRTAASQALVLVLAFEMFVGLGARGLGTAIYEFQATYRIPETYAAIITAALLGVTLNLLLGLCERRILAWLPDTESAG